MEQMAITMWEIMVYIFEHTLSFTTVCAIIVVIFQRKEPKSTWAWLLVLYFVPVFGFPIYLLAGTDMHRRKLFRVKEIEDRLSEVIRQQEYQIVNKNHDQIEKKLWQYSDLIYYNLENSGSVITENNKLNIYTDGNDLYRELKDDLKKATQSIHMQYYIIRNDILFQQIVDILEQKVKEGVEVRVLYDGMGCTKVSKKLWRSLETKGIETAEFFPALFRRLHLRINYRNHRKIVVIDNQIGYVGGFNVGKEYLGADKRYGYWRDTHMRLCGGAVTFLQLRFILDWNYAAKNRIAMNEKYGKMDIVETGNSFIQIITSGPDSSIQNIRDNYLRLIGKANQSIYIQSPYFVPDEAIMTALFIAVRSGIDVNIMIPCKPDHPFVYWATYSYIGELVMAGANCYTYENGFLHAKGMVIDEEVLCYGTANMDIRSFALNFEVNAVIYDENEAQKMTKIFIQDLKYCKQITKEKYTRRKLPVRIREQVSRLLSPLL